LALIQAAALKPTAAWPIDEDKNQDPNDIHKVPVPADTLERKVISRGVKMAFDGAAEHGAEH
jgi:hypothetical protein